MSEASKAIHRLVVGQEFTTSPGARYLSDGPKSGEEFRDTLLEARFLAAVSEDLVLEIALDGTDGYATSFLEEAFGGLARKHSPELVLKYLRFVCEEEPSLGSEIQQYIRDAKK